MGKAHLGPSDQGGHHDLGVLLRSQLGRGCLAPPEQRGRDPRAWNAAGGWLENREKGSAGGWKNVGMMEGGNGEKQRGEMGKK